MRKFQLPILLLLATLLISCSDGATATPLPTVQPTIELAEAIPTPTNTATAVPTPTNTAVPPTRTPQPEPATATTLPTRTSTSTPTTTPTNEPTATSTEPDPTSVQPNPTSVEPNPTAVPVDTATPNSPPPPAPPANPGGVIAPTDSNYPGNDDKVGWENRINLPAGFNATYYGRVIGQPTSITFGPDGQLYIAVQEGSIFTMDAAGNVSTYAGGFNTPTGIAFRPGTNQLYVSSRVLNENIGGEAQVSIINQGQLIGGLPCCYTFFHAANGIAFGPDGFGYVGVGARADHGEILVGENAGQPDVLHPLEASILRFNPDTGEVSVYATGFRNPYDIAWDSAGQLWATDNTPDFDPPERLHRVVPGANHGYPYYDCDVCFSPPPGVTVIPPLGLFTPSSSPTGVTAYNGGQFPGYNNAIFVALWSAFPGAQKIMHIGAGGSSAPVNFATGFAAPIDVVTGPDGSLYVADWATGIIFKISYTG